MLRLYTDESAGLKVDPFVVMVLSIGFIISVVALHSEFPKSCIEMLRHEAERGRCVDNERLTCSFFSHRKGHEAVFIIATRSVSRSGGHGKARPLHKFYTSS